MAVRTKDSPNGFTPINNLGGPYNGQVNRYLTTGTAVYVGDLVKLTGDSGAAGAKVGGVDVNGIPYIQPLTTAATDFPVGVVVGFEVAPTQLEQNYADASNSRIALVVDNPKVQLVCQGDGDTDVLAAADVGGSVHWIAGSGSTVTGRSGHELDDSSVTTVTTQLFRLVRLYNAPNNDMPTTSATTGTHAQWVVSFRRHAYEPYLVSVLS